MNFIVAPQSPTQFPVSVQSITGERIDVRALCQRYFVILITLKSVVCPVCPNILRILNTYGLGAEDRFIDPFGGSILVPQPNERKFFHQTLAKDLFFIVLSPGPSSSLAWIQDSTCFPKCYPFICDDVNLNIATSAGLRLSRNEIWPAAVEILPDLTMRHIKIGRGAGSYGYIPILEFALKMRYDVERRTKELIKSIRNLEDSIKERISKVEMWIADRNTLKTVAATQITQQRGQLSTLPLEILLSINSYILAGDRDKSLVFRDLISLSQVSITIYDAMLISFLTYIRLCSQEIEILLPRDEEGIPVMDLSARETDHSFEREHCPSVKESLRYIDNMELIVDSAEKWTKRWE